MNDTNSTQIIADSLQSMPFRLKGMEHNFFELKLQIDSVITLNEKMIESENYFSDIIASQMGWFALLFMLTFGILGLAYWIGVRKYFMTRFDQINTIIETHEETNTNNHSNLKEKLSTDISNLDDKLEETDNRINELFNEKFKSSDEKIMNLSKKIDDSREENSDQLKELIEKQKKEFDVEKDDLLSKINDTNFHAERGMFFTTYYAKDYFSAFTWAISILKFGIKEKNMELQDIWVNYVHECIEAIEYNKEMKDNFIMFKNRLDDIVDSIEDKKHKKLMGDCVIIFNKKYYQNVEVSDKKSGK